ncbi:O-antigen polysaccharide polymerase Wzy family protein [Terrisporobacter sp.]
MKKYIQYTTLLFSLPMFIIGCCFSNIDVILLSVCFIFINNIIYSIQKFSERIIFFAFNISFFIFLIGRLCIKRLTSYEDVYNKFSQYGLDFADNDIALHIVIVLFISLLFLFLGYSLFKEKFDEKNKKPMRIKKINDNDRKKIATVSKLIFYLTYIFSVMVYIDKARYASAMGYEGLYASYSSSLPSFFTKISEMTAISLFVYLGTLPTKKKTIIPIIMYLILGVLSLLTGQRSNFVLNIMIVLVYLCLRNITDKDYKWFGKKEIIITVCLLPILIIVLNTVSYIRAGETQKQTSAVNIINDFIYKQGASVNLIGYAKTLDEQLPEGKNYTFGRIIDFVQENAVTQLFFDFPTYEPNTIDSARYGNSFADSVSYILSPARYVRGWGYGSSYIAELYKDFGYIGVIIGNFILGGILVLMSRIFRLGPIWAGFGLSMIRLLLYSPRDTATSFIVTSLSLINILTVVIILIGVMFLKFIESNKRISHQQEGKGASINYYTSL